MSWRPLTQGRNGFFTNSILAEIGSKYGKSIVQIALRWLIQRGVIIIPKSIHIERMQQNTDISNFELTDEDMATIATLDMGYSLFLIIMMLKPPICLWNRDKIILLVTTVQQSDRVESTQDDEQTG